MTTEAAPDVRLDGVRKAYGGVIAVHDVSLAIPRGAIFSLLGPSGCGKTTTLRLIAGFEQPSTGEVYIRGKRVTQIPPYRRDFSMVFQSYALFPHLTVAQNVAFGLRMRRVRRGERDKAVAEALAMVKLEGMAERRPGQLSGGQQQRVALARAIVVRPAVLLLDEPLGALDKMLREEMQVELRQLQQSLGITAVFVTHDQEEALTLSDQIAVMRAGVIEQVGPPMEVYERPRTEFVAGFLGASNFFDGHIAAREGEAAVIETASGPIRAAGEEHGVGEQVRVAVRPEKIVIGGPGEPGLDLRIENIVYRGPTTQYHLAGPAGTVLAYRQNAAAGDAGWRVGDRVTARWDAASAVLLPAAAP